MNIYQHVSDPYRHVHDQIFSGPLSIIGSPTYGRVLFRTHGVAINRCVFYLTDDPTLTDPALLSLATDVSVCNCCFYGNGTKPQRERVQ